MIVLHGQVQHMTFQLFNNRWDQLRQSMTSIAYQNRATIFGTPHQMIVDVIMSMSCSISHSKQIITRYSERDNHSFSEKGGRTFSSSPNQRLAPAQGEPKVRGCPRADFLWVRTSLVEQMLPSMIVRELSEDEMNAYRFPYPTPDTRLLVFMWPTQIPIGGKPADVHDIVSAYAAWLPQSDLPKLQIHATLGTYPAQTVAQINDTFNNIETINFGEGLHFIQEDQPNAMGEAIAEWLDRVVFAN